MRRRPLRFVRPARDEGWNEDPLSGVANLFDVSLAFIVAILIALFSSFQAKDLFDPDSSWTMTRTAADGRLEMVRKTGRRIEVRKVTDRKLSGDGERLGVAYQLPGGQVIYVPESKAKAAGKTP